MSPTEITFRTLSRTVTRRSLIARAGVGLLALAGVATQRVGLDPFTPRVAHASDCASTIWCGLCGVPCSHCGNYYECPANTYPGYGVGSWVKCCGGYYRQYIDCCVDQPVPDYYYCGSNPPQRCDNNCPQIPWCPDDGIHVYYYCTYVSTVGITC